MAAASMPAAPAALGLSTIGQIAITVTDVDRAVRILP